MQNQNEENTHLKISKLLLEYMYRDYIKYQSNLDIYLDKTCINNNDKISIIILKDLRV